MKTNKNRPVSSIKHEDKRAILANNLFLSNISTKFATKMSSFFKVGHKKAFPREWEGEG